MATCWHDIDFRRLLRDSTEALNSMLSDIGLMVICNFDAFDEVIASRERAELWDKFKYVAIPRVA